MLPSPLVQGPAWTLRRNPTHVAGFAEAGEVASEATSSVDKRAGGPAG